MKNIKAFVVPIIIALLIQSSTIHINSESITIVDTVSSLISNHCGSLTVGTLGLASAALFYKKWVHPHFELPQPTGPYKVGTSSHHLVDTSWVDPLAPKEFESDYRELIVQCWYPSQTNIEQSLYDYMPHKIPYLLETLVSSYSLPAQLITPFFPAVYKHAIDNASIASSNVLYPLVLFTHGISSLCDLHTAQLENLASHGFIVIGINHTHGCMVNLFPDGRVKEFYYNELLTDQEQSILWTKTGTKDMRFVLDTLEKVPLNMMPIAKNIDFDHVGVLSYSGGGVIALNLCQEDKRIKAIVNLDGWEELVAHMINESQTIPTMYMVKDPSMPLTGLDPSTEKLLDLHHASATDSYHITTKGTQHNSFNDLPLIKQKFLPFLIMNKFKGGMTTDPYTVNNLINDCAVTFFNKYLKRINVDWPSPSTAYPEFFMLRK